MQHFTHDRKFYRESKCKIRTNTRYSTPFRCQKAKMHHITLDRKLHWRSGKTVKSICGSLPICSCMRISSIYAHLYPNKEILPICPCTRISSSQTLFIKITAIIYHCFHYYLDSIPQFAVQFLVFHLSTKALPLYPQAHQEFHVLLPLPVMHP